MYISGFIGYPINMPTSTENALVRLYYENFGFSVEEIAANLELRPVVVKSLVNELGLVAPKERKIADDKKALLMERDLDKQLILTPFYARAEVAILSKLFDTAASINKDDPGAAQQISNCARALKDLKSAGVQAKLEDANAAGGVTVQILNQM